MPETKTPSKLGILEKGLLYKPYCRLRTGGLPAVQIYKAWKEDAIETDAMDINSLLVKAVGGTMVFTLVASVVMKLTYTENHKIWLTSPSGKTTIQLPLYQALRTIRKRGWKFTKVEPIKIPRTISKKEGLHTLVSKNKCKEENKTSSMKNKENTIIVSVGIAMVLSGVVLIFCGPYNLPGLILSIVGLIITTAGAILFKPTQKEVK